MNDVKFVKNPYFQLKTAEIAPGYCRITPAYRNTPPRYCGIPPLFRNIPPRYCDTLPGYCRIPAGYRDSPLEYRNIPVQCHRLPLQFCHPAGVAIFSHPLAELDEQMRWHFRIFHSDATVKPQRKTDYGQSSQKTRG
jgi:hypothetical protein